MRVLHLLDSLSLGGTERNAVRVLRELGSLGVDARLAVFRDGPLRTDVEAAGIPLLRLSLSSFYSPALLRESRRLARFVRQERIDLVHAHDRYSNAFVAVARLLGGRVPTIASKRWDSRADPWPMRAASRVAFRSATRVLANSEAVARTLTRDDGVASGKIRVIPNFVDDGLLEAPSADLRAETRAELGIGLDEPVIVCVANLRPVKNHLLLLEAVASVRASVQGVQLLLVGEGSGRVELEARAKALGLRHATRFLGQRPDAWRLHAAGDISVLTSDSEGFPNSLLEAQALGIPVVATSVGGVAEVVTDQQSGLLVAPRDAGGLASAMVTLLGDPSLRASMGANARALTRARYGRVDVVARLMELYREILPSGSVSDRGAQDA